MKYLILSIIAIPFIYFNFKILQRDIKDKIIPNKYLVYLLGLLPLVIIYFFFFYKIEINIIILIFQITFSLLITFLLYYYGIWGAGDAKYLLVLSLFISHIGVMRFLGNIAIIILIYLLIYFIYFYFGKCLFNLKYANSLYKNIFIDIKDKLTIFLNHDKLGNNKKTSIKIVLNWIILFLFVFVSFRLIRFYIVSDYTSNSNIESIGKVIKNYQLYLMAGVFFIFWIFRYLINILFIRLKSFSEKKLGLKYDKTKIIFPLFLISFLIGFIIYEYIINPYEIIIYLYKIFTIYILLYIIFRITFYMYKLTFYISETYYKNLNDLAVGDIIDKKYLIDVFGKQQSLGYENNLGILYPNPGSYFSKISNPIDIETVNNIKNIYFIVNESHIKEKTSNYTPIDSIKILMSFSFAPYIFLGFLLTLFFKDKIYIVLVDIFLELTKRIFN